MARRKSRLLPIGLGLIGLSIVCGVVGVLSLVALFTNLFNAEIRDVPGTFTEVLEPNQYLVAVEPAPGVNVLEVVVLDPAGVELPTEDGTSQTISRNNDEFRGSRTFEAETAGTYSITVSTSGPSRAIVTRSLTGLSGGDALGFGLAALSVLLFVVGTIMVIVGLVGRRRRSNDDQTSGWQPPSPPASYGGPGPGLRFDTPQQHPSDPGAQGPGRQPPGWPQG